MNFDFGLSFAWLRERERERALHIGRTFSLRAETDDDDGRVFFFL